MLDGMKGLGERSQGLGEGRSERGGVEVKGNSDGIKREEEGNWKLRREWRGGERKRGDESRGTKEVWKRGRGRKAPHQKD